MAENSEEKSKQSYSGDGIITVKIDLKNSFIDDVSFGNAFSEQFDLLEVLHYAAAFTLSKTRLKVYPDFSLLGKRRKQT